ncbi:MAG: hypothetical protein OK422_00180 [Thaumarchaeota archaeon]|nr:hypothetical protein [Nitrososphaerota archaeon]
MAFSIVVFVAALWALMSEMVEDLLVNLIYGHMFGWRNLVYALIAASTIIVVSASLLIYYSASLLLTYVDTITKLSAILLGAIGIFWLGSSLFRPEDESVAEEARRNISDGKPKSRSFIVLLQLVSIEELEIFLIIVPLILASHSLEASTAATIGVVTSVSVAALLRKKLERFLAGKFRYLKMASGVFLLALGVVLLSGI